MNEINLLIKKGGNFQLKDTHLIYLILSKIFDEYNEIKLMKKIVDLSNKSDDEIKDFLSKIKVEDKK